MKKVVGICGLIGHGKDTAAGFLIEGGYKRISFAGVLKDACANIFGWDRILLEGNTPESRVWREAVDPWWAERLDMPDFSPRVALQRVGTNVMRHHFHPDIWVAAAERKIMATDGNVVISDCRFFNELEVIKRLGGTTAVVWRKEKPVWWTTACDANLNKTSGMEEQYPEVHPSEWSWAGWEFDHVLDNTQDLDHLRMQTVSKL